jgi:hypothetical protein
MFTGTFIVRRAASDRLNPSRRTGTAHDGASHAAGATTTALRSEAEQFTLTVVGETWEGHELPLSLIAISPHRRTALLELPARSGDRYRVTRGWTEVVEEYEAALTAMLGPVRRRPRRRA